MSFAELRRHRMRAYYLPLAAGALLAASAFLPWVMHAGVGVGGVPAASALWVLALGVAAMVLAALSVVTRKNSRHPLLVVGLVALAVEFLAWQWMQRSVAEQAWASAQASAIVAGGRARAVGETTIGAGLYLGIAAASAIVLFGLTIVFKQASRPYAPPEDDV
ncbi:MAG: hypothetical protein ACRD26_05860 [Vicinamibacterales bacterium]